MVSKTRSDEPKSPLATLGGLVVAVSMAAFLSLRFISSDQVRVFIWSGDRPPQLGSWRVCMSWRFRDDLATYRPLVSAVGECIEPTYVRTLSDLHIGRYFALFVSLLLYWTIIIVGRYIFNSKLMAVIFAATISTSSMIVAFSLIGLSGIAAPLALIAVASSTWVLLKATIKRGKKSVVSIGCGTLLYLIGLSLFPAWAMSAFVLMALALVWQEELNITNVIRICKLQLLLAGVTATYIGMIKVAQFWYERVSDVKLAPGDYAVTIGSPAELSQRLSAALLFQAQQPYLGLVGVYGVFGLMVMGLISSLVVRSLTGQSATQHSRVLGLASIAIVLISIVVALTPTLTTTIPLTAHKVAPLLVLVAAGASAVASYSRSIFKQDLLVAVVFLGLTGLWAGQRATVATTQSAWELNRLEHGAESWLKWGLPNGRVTLIVIPYEVDPTKSSRFSSLDLQRSTNYMELGRGPGDVNRFFPALMGVFRTLLPNSPWPLNFTYSAEDALRIPEPSVSVSNDPTFFCNEKAFAIDLRDGSIGIPPECDQHTRP